MQFKVNKYIVLLIISIIISACSTSKPSKKVVYKKVEKVNKTTPTTTKKTETPKTTIQEKKETVIVKEKEVPLKVNLPKLDREFRAAWVATVANINWPSKRDLSVQQQKEEAIQLLDLLINNNFNAVIFQARPSADALYKSNYEPWSYFLNGETGKAPVPFYDPLEFWVEEAHKRGLELHVWLNPYRAHHSSGGGVTKESMVNKKPEDIVKLKNGMYWFDPAKKSTQDHVSKIVMDIVKRYDIDGIHFDDYFYPYASYNGGADFPDNKSWDLYKKNGGKLTRADWRRENVNTIIERVYKEIKDLKSYVKFGISPFGIWKPGYPQGITGSSQYDELYADAKLWLNKGWIDYFAPQLYWPINSTGQSFPKLLEWWQSQNTYNRHLWPGLNTVEVKVKDRTGEILNQVKVSKDILPSESNGTIHWSIAGLTKNQQLLNSLKSGPYKEKVLVPKMPWIESDNIVMPKLVIEDLISKVEVSWHANKYANVANWVIFKKYGDVWETDILDKQTTTQNLPKIKNNKKLTVVAVKAIDRAGYESDYVASNIK